MTTELVRYDSARRALAEAKRVDEVAEIRNQAEAMRAYSYCVISCRWQQGHRGSRRAKARASLMRMVAMELATCRSGRSGGAAGSVTLG